MPAIETVTVFRTWVEVADALKSDAERGKLYHAICRYALYGESPQLDGLLSTYFTLMQPSIDKSAKRKAAINKRWNDIQTDVQTGIQTDVQNNIQTDVQNGIQTDIQNNTKTGIQNGSTRARQTGTGTGKKRVSKETPKETVVSFAGLIPEPLRVAAFIRAWAEWEAARKANRKKLSLRAARSQLALLEQYPAAEAVEMINASIRNDWQGIFPLKAQPKLRGEKDYSGI
ncbi:DUF6291 domain-containing protein [Victivallis sp. Marseille-Q1083]|uniref:DUF6291 domain-containing protein n=1 Tax=Victivallis sp. Marseille-Q1083 TaxID=2717288 RepID=UPI00158D6DAE|nr:DUF6291 domain-containing protein [Victivallis sp. Marseille-Q1083]